MRDGAGELFGVLTFVREGLWTLKATAESADIVKVEVSDATGSVVVTDGVSSELVAEAVRCMGSEFFSAGEHLEMRLEPGADCVLAVLCCLGVLLFSNTPTIPHSKPLAGASRPRSPAESSC